MLTLIKGAHVFAPEDMGTKDLLLVKDQIAALDDTIETPTGVDVAVIEGRGKYLTPGFIDLHVHLLGGGGEGGPTTRLPELMLSRITTGGVTTVVGLLGTDDLTRRPEALLAKTHALQAEGISAFMLCGSYRCPPVSTVTGSVRKDMAFIDSIIGVGELAIADHRSSQPSFDDLKKVAAATVIGGLLGKKAGLLNFHMGSGPAGFDLLMRLVKETEIPISRLLPTHVTRTARLFQQAVQFAGLGGHIDITASLKREKEKGLTNFDALRQLKKTGISLDHVTFSSDANGSLPQFDENGNFVSMKSHEPAILHHLFVRLVTAEGYDIADVLPCFTRNPARRIAMDGRKGSIAEKKDGDLVLHNADGSIDKVFCMGRLMVSGGKPMVRGVTEEIDFSC